MGSASRLTADETFRSEGSAPGDDVSCSVADLDPSDASRWDEYVSRAAGASLYHLHGWRDVIAETFGHRTFYLAASSRAGRLVGVLPLIELRSAFFGGMLVSLPFFNYGGICADNETARDALLNAAISRARQRRVDFLELRHDAPSFADLPVKTSKVSMRRVLPDSSDALWKELGSKLRNQVQRPRKEGLTAIVGRGELLDDFFRVFSVNMRDLGTPVYSRRFFRNVMTRFPDRTWIAAVYLHGTPVAAGFLSGFRARLEIPWASSLKSFSRLSPNMLLYWTCLEFACRSGYREFDFGRSSVDSGTFKFKAQWGAQPHPLYWHYWLPEGAPLPNLSPTNGKYRAAIAVWQRLPVSLTRWLGPGIVKYLP
jgi:serine/alanine adding enzyme